MKLQERSPHKWRFNWKIGAVFQAEWLTSHLHCWRKNDQNLPNHLATTPDIEIYHQKTIGFHEVDFATLSETNSHFTLEKIVVGKLLFFLGRPIVAGYVRFREGNIQFFQPAMWLKSNIMLASWTHRLFLESQPSHFMSTWGDQLGFKRPAFQNVWPTVKLDHDFPIFGGKTYQSL